MSSRVFSDRALSFQLLHICLVVASVAASASAQTPGERTLVLPEKLQNYSNPELPAHFAAADIASFDTTPAANLLTDAGASLGRVLFYDELLSASGTISCGSCHIQANAFSDPRQFSEGFAGQKTDRNSMSLNDLRYVRAGFFWDERETSLEDAVLVPLFSHVEMGLNAEQLVSVVQTNPLYPPLFTDAFGTADVSPERVGRALAQFIRAMVSHQSRFDLAAAESESFAEDFSGFTESENLGKQLFVDKCAACHTLGQQQHKVVFAMFRSLNNGVDADATARDAGRGDITFNPTELGLFKASSLRNVEYTAPYMHDGRLRTLEDVIEHYSSGVLRHPTLSAVQRMDFNADEKNALVDFLKTLSDPQFIHDPKFSDPWQRTVAKADEQAIPRDLQERVHAGQGLSPAETARWIAELDQDDDGVLSQEELRPLAQVLIETSASGRLRPAAVNGDAVTTGRGRGARAGNGRRGRGGRGRGPAARGERGAAGGAGDDTATTTEELPKEADLNGDGEISDAEARSYPAMQRLFQFGDGHRLDVLLDRVLGSFPIPAELRPEARMHIREAKLALNRQVVEFNEQTEVALRELLGAELHRAFQTSVVAATATGRRGATANAQPTVDDMLATILTFDQSEDGGLDAEEQARLCHELTLLPGGFAQTAPPAPEMAQFAERILAFDADGSGSVTEDELPERMSAFARDADGNGDGRLTLAEAQSHFTSAAFAQLRDEGIYIGGAFDNTLLFHRAQLAEIGLAAAELAKAQAIIDQHAALITTAWQEAFARELVMLRELCQR